MKISLICIATFLLLTVMPTALKAEALPVSLDSAHRIDVAKQLLTRLDEINAIDRATLCPLESKKLRKELRGIKSNLKELDGGTYVPIGSLVVLLLVPVVVFNFLQ